MAKAKVAEAPSLEERITALHAELDELIDRAVDQQMVPGVPRPVIKQLVLARCHGLCRCMAAKTLSEKGGTQ